MSNTAASPPIAIIGFGFSGLMVTANLLRETTSPLTIYIIDTEPNAKGAAYSTTQPLHLLNVIAERMGAWANAPDDFLKWLSSDEGKYASAALKLSTNIGADDYAPRMLYSEYLQSIWREAQALAAQKNCTLKLVPSCVVAIQYQEHELHILTERGDAIAAQHAVLAVGNESKNLYPNIPLTKLVQRPWNPGALDICTSATSIAIIGTGLTTVDAILSLRALGYRGKITALSRNGLLPQPHSRSTLAPYSFNRDALLSHASSLSTLLHYIRTSVRNHTGDWREIIDALRPHTQVLWRHLPSADQKRFFQRLSSIWGVHRHRMAAHIATSLDDEIAAQQLSVIAAKNLRASYENNKLRLQWREKDGEHHLTPDVIINCTGVELNITRSKNPLLRQLLENGLIEPHTTSIGIATDAQLRAYGHAHGKLYIIGGLLTGQLLETIAVPELREQAQSIARSIVKKKS